jgi:hypothetical protein
MEVVWEILVDFEQFMAKRGKAGVVGGLTSH